MQWQWSVIALWLAIGLGGARWFANLAEIDPWRSRIAELHEIAFVPPKLLTGGMLAIIVVGGPVGWALMWWNTRHDDERPD